MARQYNLKNIRALLTEGFSEPELRTLCHENFKAVHHGLASGDGKTEILSRLLDYAEQKLELEKVLTWAKENNPARYQQHQPYYADEKPETDHPPTAAAGGLKAWWQGLFYAKKYRQYLIYRHRDFDVKGLSTQGIYTLALEQVFVELSIVPQPPHQTSADPIRAVPASLNSGSHVIWDYLQAEAMQNQHLVIIGAPGSGKTTLLKHMTLALAAKRKHQASTQLLHQYKLPILLFLRDHAATIKDNPELSLIEAVQNNLARWKMQAPIGWLENQLGKGHCLIMMDGLDEVADLEIRRCVVEWVERQMVACAKNRFIITSRPFGYRTNPLSGVTVLEIRPFTYEQVKRFVHNWYLANEIMSAQNDDLGVYMAAQERAEDLLQRLHNAPALLDLAVNPLLLTMIATVHRYRSSLPGRRVELYAEICEVSLGKRQQARGLELDLTPAQKQRVLQPLAYYMMSQHIREIRLDEALVVMSEALQLVNPNSAGGDFLKMIENSSGLFLERERGEYSFAHLTFQEYLAAVHAQEQRLENELVRYVAESWWHETLRLYGAQADATPIIEACLAGDQPAVLALALAIECLEEARELHPTVRAQLETIFTQGLEDKDPERRQLVAETLLALRLRRLRRVSEDKYMDDTLITHAEYQLFLDEQRIQGQYYQPDHWLTFQFPTGQGRSPVAGVRSTDAVAFCKWLTEREAKEWTYRLPLVEEVAGNTQLELINFWIKDSLSDNFVLHNASLFNMDVVTKVEDYLINDQVRALGYNPFLARTNARTLDNTLLEAGSRDLTLALTRYFSGVDNDQTPQDNPDLIPHFADIELARCFNLTITDVIDRIRNFRLQMDITFALARFYVRIQDNKIRDKLRVKIKSQIGKGDKSSREIGLRKGLTTAKS